jgi:hypothetical protein
VSPERVANKEWREVINRFPPDFIAMDEAHTFGNWADTFRPGYKFAGDFIREVNPKVDGWMPSDMLDPNYNGSWKHVAKEMAHRHVVLREPGVAPAIFSGLSFRILARACYDFEAVRRPMLN